MRANTGTADLAKLRQQTEAMNVGPVQVQGLGTPRRRGDPLRPPARWRCRPGGRCRPGQESDRRRLHRAPDGGGRPTVSGELVQSGTLGVVLSIVAVLCYLSFRFEWQFAVGAIIATMHDLLLTVGFFSITHLEFNTTSIAAILTIVGYS